MAMKHTCIAWSVCGLRHLAFSYLKGQRTAHWKRIAVASDSRYPGMYFNKNTRDLDFYVQHAHQGGKEQV